MSATSRITQILLALQGWEGGPRANVTPVSRTIDLDLGDSDQMKRYVQFAGCAFVCCWVTGTLPDDARISMTRSDGQQPFRNLRWGDQKKEPLFFVSPLLIPANDTISIESSRGGSLSLHGVFVYRRGAEQPEIPQQEKLFAVVEGLKELGKLLREETK